MCESVITEIFFILQFLLYLLSKSTFERAMNKRGKRKKKLCIHKAFIQFKEHVRYYCIKKRLQKKFGYVHRINERKTHAFNSIKKEGNLLFVCVCVLKLFADGTFDGNNNHHIKHLNFFCVLLILNLN